MYLCTKRIPNAESVNQRARGARRVARRGTMRCHVLIPVPPRLRADELDIRQTIVKCEVPHFPLDDKPEGGG